MTQKIKQKIIISGLFSLVVILMPLQISTLYSNADESTVMNNVPGWEESQKELQMLSDEEQKLNQELVALNNQTNSSVVSDEAEKVSPPDPAIAPGEIKLKVFLKDNNATPNFPVSVKFIGVGGKTFETKVNSSGNAQIELSSGRYYGEIISDNNNYKLFGDPPAFFVNAGEKKDLGEYYLAKK